MNPLPVELCTCEMSSLTGLSIRDYITTADTHITLKHFNSYRKTTHKNNAKAFCSLTFRYI